LGAAITGLLGNRARREALGSRARAKISRRFTREQMLRETHVLYLRALAE
jgi:hypothetical protein